MGVVQEINLLLSKTAITELNRQLDEASKAITQTIEKAVNEGGAADKAKAQAIARVRALKAELDRESRALQSAVEKGLLGAKEAALLGQDAGKAYGEALAKELTRAQKAGVLTRTDLAVLAKQVGGASGLGTNLFNLQPPDAGPFERFFGKIKGLALGVGTAIAGVFALRKLGEFARDSIREFLKDAKQLDDLRSTVQGLGRDFEALRPEIDAASDAFVAAGRGSGSDFQRILQQLSLTSGDFDKSIRNVTLVSDLAAAKQISLTQATQLVGRAMIGQVEPLRRMGIEVKKGEDGVLALNKAVGGFVERQGPTLAKSVAALTNGWHDLQSAIGEALITAGGGTSTIDGLAGVVRGLTQWVRENRDVLVDLGKAVVSVAGFFARDLGGSLKDAQSAIRNTKLEFALITLGASNFSAGISEAAGRLRQFGGIAIAVWAEIKARAGFNPVESQTVAASWMKMGDDLIATAKRTRDEASKAWQDAKDEAAAARREIAEGPNTGGLRVFTGKNRNVVGGAVKGATTNPRGEGTGRGRQKDALAEEIRLLSEGVKLDQTKAASTARLEEIERELLAARAQSNLTLDQQIGIERKLHDVREALGRDTILTTGSIGQQVDFLGKLLPLTETHAFALKELTERQKAYREELESLVTPERRLELVKGLEEINNALTADRFRRNQRGGGQPGSLPGGVDVTVDPALVDRLTQQTLDAIQEPLRQGTEQIQVSEFFEKAFGKDLHEVASEAADFIGDEFGAVFERLFSDAENLSDVFGDLGKGLAAGLLKEIAQLAGAKAKENIAEAIEETAEGFAALFLNPPKAAAHFKSAALHTAAAVAWSALGGAAGAGGNALSQTGGAGGGGGSDLRDRPSDRLDAGGRGQATIILQGGDFFDLSNRQTLDQFAKMISLVGDYDVVIRRGAA